MYPEHNFHIPSLASFPASAAIRLQVAVADASCFGINEFEVDLLGGAVPSITLWRPILSGSRPVGQVLFQAAPRSGSSISAAQLMCLGEQWIDDLTAGRDSSTLSQAA